MDFNHEVTQFEACGLNPVGLVELARAAKSHQERRAHSGLGEGPCGTEHGGDLPSRAIPIGEDRRQPRTIRRTHELAMIA